MKTLRALMLANLVIAVVQAPAARAQTGTISGTVVNAATREPMPGVLISLATTPLSAVTNADGAFTVLFVPPGVYTVSARRSGFATFEYSNVDVQAAHTRTLAFALRASSGDTTESVAFAPPFVDPKLGGTAIRLTRDEMAALPVLTVAGALAVNGGFLELPRSIATLSLGDLHRGMRDLPSVRAGRPEATLYLLDGIAVNNPVFGSPPLLIEPMAAAGVTFAPAHVDAEHGAALSGLVDQSIREGTRRPSGAFEYQSTALAGALGSGSSDASGTYSFRGYVAAPLPIAGGALKFSLAGHALGEKANVTHLGTGWHASGGTENDQIVAKLSYAVRPTVTWSVAAVGQRRAVIGLDPDYIEGDSVAPATVRELSRFIVTRVDKRFTRANISLALADNHATRESCSIWVGVCVMDRFMRNPIGSEIPAFGPPPLQTPYAVSGQYFGGESYDTRTVRADLVMQPTDHHRVAVGIYAASHDLTYRDAIGYRWLQGVILTAKDAYRTHPTEFATYMEDAMEYDFVTLHFGVRVDYGNSGGVAFVNPLDPTNGTTAREVCEGTAPGINTTPFTYGSYSGIAACINAPSDLTGRSALLDSAARLAQQDDFHTVHPRAAFSPRFGMSFPLTEQSALFFNIGRYNRQPLYHDAYRNTGLGSRAGMGAGDDNMCESFRARPGTNECTPSLTLDPAIPEFVGNPDLSFETADAWEAGFTSQLGRDHSVEASFFSNKQSHLPTLYTSTLTPDIGLTYGVLGQHPNRTVLGGGSIESMGTTVTMHRRPAGPLSYSLTYTWQRSDEIGARPDLVAEAMSANELFDNSEDRISARLHPQTLNAQFTLQWREQTPKGLGPVSSAVLRNSRTVLTLYNASATKAPTTSEATCTPTLGQPCAPIGGGVAGTGLLINAMHVRTIATHGVRWSLIVRGLNVLDANDGSADILRLDQRRGSAGTGRTAQPKQGVSMRRIVTGVSLNF